MRLANTGKNIIIVSRSQGLFTGVLFEWLKKRGARRWTRGDRVPDTPGS
jgi:hypothetical protein